MKRVHGIDIVRGLVMVVMALDHIRDLMHAPSLSNNPTDLATTSPAIFFTRFITHFCAPTFVFLAGTSAFLSLQKSGNVSANRSFLIKRGLWLIFLEFTVVGFGIWFDIGFHTILFQVIAALGFGFIFLGLLLKFSSGTIGIVGIALLIIQTILPLLPVADGSIKTIFSFLFFSNFVPLGEGRALIYAYPILSWTAILFMGYGVGSWFTKSNYQSRLLATGSICVTTFFVLRLLNIGDLAPWSMQKDLIFTVMSFLNVTKYPPTLQFCLLTLGVMFILLWLAGKSRNGLTEILETFGKVPMFYYLIHWYAIHGTLILLLLIQGFSFGQMHFEAMRFGRPLDEFSGVNLGWIYVIWFSIVTILYFPCRSYSRYKSQNKSWWLRYL
ncbi:MAG: DUF1624 domain-containing protein [Flavobacterium sp.]|uniref:DUF1624 domain-containing protein n=1 Tax=Flavobacterium sp. TaxID=239 RepID=UPI001215FD9C|nr:heparan-alpha-glucosaminide N-acetyltransferase domain-containing protein [Flavobacterium sp.]RZJ65911.1 MAG: DUF1624 domain-containing protein [Flavobacterium sp.]